tara:strand:- start:347 stop:976 length:630 start_codon:yes stop_codon:yes gene_type:complete
LTPLHPEPKYFLQAPSNLDKISYLSKFKPLDGEFIFGEKSTTYIESEAAALKIKEFFPDALIIICLRDPAERALSNYFFSLQHGLETRTLEGAFLYNAAPPSIDLSKFSTNPLAYKERGLYSHQLDYYRKIFPADQLLITFMEHFTTSEAERLKILDFLGAKKSPTLHQNKINSSRRQPVDPAIYSALDNYYKSDRDNLTINHKLPLPY